MTRIPRPFETVVRTPAELFAVWEGLMGPGGFGTASLWLIFFDAEHRLQPVISPIEDIPAEPDAALIDALASILDEPLADGPGSSAALLLSRPGPVQMTAADRRWAQALRAGLSERLAAWPLHLATRDRVQVFAPDDLIPAA
jgi:hypothetical protein